MAYAALQLLARSCILNEICSLNQIIVKSSLPVKCLACTSQPVTAALAHVLHQTTLTRAQQPTGLTLVGEAVSHSVEQPGGHICQEEQAHNQPQVAVQQLPGALQQLLCLQSAPGRSQAQIICMTSRWPPCLRLKTDQCGTSCAQMQLPAKQSAAVWLSVPAVSCWLRGRGASLCSGLHLSLRTAGRPRL